MHEFQKVLEEYELLTSRLSAGGGFGIARKNGSPTGGDLARLGKRRTELEPVVARIRNYESQLRELEDNKKLLSDPDPAIKEMAESEAIKLESAIASLKAEIEADLLPRDPLDANDVIVEIRAGTGGDESTLFSAQLYRMYARFAEHMGWKTHVISSSKSEAGGFKEIIFELRGLKNPGKVPFSEEKNLLQSGVFGVMKFESGVHRVQRVPATEKSGRVHTSTVTVAILPIMQERDFTITPGDLKIETSTSRGAGGQSVNTTYSAIKITHLPTGITASSQDERSQIQNRAKALQVITARVYAYEQEKKQQALSQKRRSQIGTGDRSEKIRTYNFPQDRITDHRINQNFKQVNLILEGELSPLISALQKADVKMRKETLKE